MPKLILQDVSNPLVNPISFQTAINNNNQLIEEAIENTLSRNGKTPNQMTSDLDMNNQDIINLNDLHAKRLYLGDRQLIPVGQEFAIDGVSPKQFGATGDGVTDDTAAIKMMFSFKPPVIDWGGPGDVYRTTEMLVVDWRTWWVGHKPRILFDWTVHGFCINMLYFAEQAEGSVISGLIFDHNCSDAVMPYLNNGTDLILMDAVRCGANNTTFSFCEFHRSGINGLSLQRHSDMIGDGQTPGTAFKVTNVSFYPILCRVSNCYFDRCGYLQVLPKFSTATDPALFVKGGGAGLNLLSASRNTVTNCTMNWCSVGYTTDFSAGAVANTISNIVIEGPGRAYPLADHPFNGVGCWFGGEQNNYSNFSCVAPLKHGFVISQFSRNSSFVNFMAYNCGWHGFYGASNNISMTNCQAIGASLAAPNTYDGFHLNVTAGTWSGFNMVNCRTASDTDITRYGLYINRTTGNISGTAVACDFNGQTADVNLNGNTGFTVV